MAFPYIFRANFEGGVSTEWDSTTGSLLTFPHFSNLARTSGLPAPYEGAYCAMIDLRGGTTADQTVTEGDIDIATGATRWFRWAMYVSSDFAATANDNFSIFELQQADNTQVYTVGFTITATTDAITVWVGEADTPETTSTLVVPKGRWFIVEVQANVDTAAANGDITVYIDGATYVSLTTTVQNAGAIGQGVLGTQVTAATTTGIILLDDFVMDDLQLYPPNERFPYVRRLTKTGHAFVGPGSIDSMTILSANGTLDVYDTDTANVNDEHSKKIQLDTGGNFVSHDLTTRFERGCYCVLGGTNPLVEVKLSRKGGQDHGPFAYGSDGAIRLYGTKRLPRPLNV